MLKQRGQHIFVLPSFYGTLQEQIFSVRAHGNAETSAYLLTTGKLILLGYSPEWWMRFVAVTPSVSL